MYKRKEYKIRILSVVGTRPQYIKLWTLINHFDENKISNEWLDTGQHYDYQLSGALIEDLGIRPAILNLNVGSHTQGKQTGIMIEKIEKFLLDNSFDNVLVFGDTNSTLAGALAASKLGINLVHIESGLRSKNRIPEEINRKVVDHISNIHFVPTVTAFNNLISEGISNPILSGDSTVDALNAIQMKFSQKIKSEPYILCTIHRNENTDNSMRLQEIFKQLSKLNYLILISAHPRLKKSLANVNKSYLGSNLQFIEPVTYSNLINLLINSESVITDSGGIQKESFILRKPCITLRDVTEWPETLEGNWNVLVNDLDSLAYVLKRDVSQLRSNPFGDGTAGLRITQHLLRNLPNMR
jgi:UDP-GlcNAc3NAcA epimerase